MAVTTFPMFADSFKNLIQVSNPDNTDWHATIDIDNIKNTPFGILHNQKSTTIFIDCFRNQRSNALNMFVTLAYGYGQYYDIGFDDNLTPDEIFNCIKQNTPTCVGKKKPLDILEMMFELINEKKTILTFSVNKVFMKDENALMESNITNCLKALSPSIV